MPDDPDDTFTAPTERVQLVRQGSPPEAVPSRLPATIGRFLVRGLLGTGVAGVVLEATDPVLKRTVAVKLLSEEWARDPAQLRRFQVEAQILAQLSHPGIIPVHEAGTLPDGRPFYVMKKLAGRTLESVLAALRAGDPATVAQWTLHRLLGAFVQLCNAIAHAHEQGVIHRDLKPSNVMLGPSGELLVLAWGVARVMGTSPEPSQEGGPVKVEIASKVRTLDGKTIGTPGFMSPEQARGEVATLDGRSDVFALGAILYELLALEPAYSGRNPMAILLQASRAPAEDPRKRAPERKIPELLAQACLAALELDRDRRLASAALLAAAVEQFLASGRT